MTTHESSEQHDWHSMGWVDEWIAMDQTRLEERLPRFRKLVGLIPFAHDQAIRVLDVGAGYGLLSRVVLEAFPKAQVTCHDYSEAMLTRASEQLKGYASQVSWVKGNLRDPDWTRQMVGPFDVIVSSIAIHNGGSAERIRSIYFELYRLVKRGGCLLNIDWFGPAGEFTRRLYEKEWLEQRQRRGKQHQGKGKRAESPGAVERAKQPGRGRAGGFGTVSMEDQLHFLHEAGFDEVECFWKDMRAAIIGGYRSPK